MSVGLKSKSTAFSSLCNYSLGNAIAMLSGVISFPIFTRMLSSNEYGVMSLINISIALCVAFGKSGLQQSLIRHWRDDSVEDTRKAVVSTAFVGTIFTTAVCLFIFCSISTVMPIFKDNSMSRIKFVGIVSSLVFLESLRSILFNREIAMQHTLKYNIGNVSFRYMKILFAISCMLILGASVTYLFVGFILASALIVIFFFPAEPSVGITVSEFQPKLFKSMVIFGAPLIFYELSDGILGFSDRYLISYYLGNVAVGQYSAGYNLTFNIQTLIITSISLTIYPLMVKTFNEGGMEATQKFVNECLQWYVLVVSAVILLFIIIGPDLLLLMASERYREATYIIWPVVSGIFFYGIYMISASELFIRKNTLAMLAFMGSASVLNIISNVYLIPRTGIMGAAYSTLIADAFLAVVGLFILGSAGLLKRMVSLAHYILPALTMFLVLSYLPAETSWISVFIRLLAGLLIWSSCVFVFIGKLRRAPNIGRWR